MDDTWKCLTELGVAATAAVLGVSLKVITGPKGYVLLRIPGIKIAHHTPVSSIGKALGAISIPKVPISVGTAVSIAPQFFLQFALDKTLIDKVVKNVNDIILPIFTVRRDRKKPINEAPDGGRDRVYSLYEKMTVTALISHLGVSLPMNFDLRVPASQDVDKIKAWYHLQARVLFKNLLGSYADENCLRDISYGMAEDEYIAQMLGSKDTNLAKSWNVDKAYRGEKHKRPISFLRFLCVCSGLAQNHIVTQEDKALGQDRVWDGLGPDLPGKRLVSQMKGKTMQPIFGRGNQPGDWKRRQNQIWRDPQEEDFASLDHSEIRDPRILLHRYRCMPAVEPEYVSSLIRDVQSEAKIEFNYSAPPNYSEFKKDILLKQRWLMDQEEPTCSTLRGGSQQNGQASLSLLWRPFLFSSFQK